MYWIIQENENEHINVLFRSFDLQEAREQFKSIKLGTKGLKIRLLQLMETREAF